jgi:uncharacterized membrane-anchored protein
VPHEDGDRQVGLLGPVLQLGEQRLDQRFEVLGERGRVGVLGLQVADDLGVGLVPQPLVGVDDDVAVVLADVRPTGGLRRSPGLGCVVTHEHRP